MSRPTFLTINLHSLQSNLARVRTLAPTSKIMAMVKANGYGHGLLRIGRVLKEADALGVASLDEGIQLREGGVRTPIVLIEGLFYSDELALAAKHDFTLVVHQETQFAMLEQTKVSHTFPVWLKINTGMNRLGISPNDTETCLTRLKKLKNVTPLGVMTHFASADLKNSAETKNQIALFDAHVNTLSVEKCLCNSAGVLGWKEAHADWVRPGLMLYGASPFPDTTGKDFGLTPVMTLASRLIAITHVKAGGKVGYGGTYTAPADMRVGVVAAGYGDGYPQFARNSTPVLVNDAICPLVGRVSMDMLTVDLTSQPHAKIDDPVQLWGETLPVEQVAKMANTSAYELFTRMTSRPKIEEKT